jgi:hypothetical protein
VNDLFYWFFKLYFSLFRTNTIPSIGDAQAKKVGNSTSCENCKRAEKTNRDCYEIEPNPPKDKAMHEGAILVLR